jgi:hypothetical protein
MKKKKLYPLVGVQKKNVQPHILIKRRRKKKPEKKKNQEISLAFSLKTLKFTLLQSRLKLRRSIQKIKLALLLHLDLMKRLV